MKVKSNIVTKVEFQMLDNILLFPIIKCSLLPVIDNQVNDKYTVNDKCLFKL